MTPFVPPMSAAADAATSARTAPAGPARAATIGG